jgi:glutamate synthase (ferredoxin)
MQVMPAFFEAGKDGSLKQALANLCAAAEEAVRGGVGCLIISDRCDELQEGRVPVPPLLAVGAVHHHLITARLRSDTSIVADTAQCFSTHHVAVLVGYAAKNRSRFLSNTLLKRP